MKRLAIVAIAVVLPSAPLPSRAQDGRTRTSRGSGAAISPERAERDRLQREFRALAAAQSYDPAFDDQAALDAAIAALSPTACRWALAVAALSSRERNALFAAQDYTIWAGADGALVGAYRCANPTDQIRIRHALGAPGWARELLEATAAHRADAVALEATLPAADATLLASLRAANGDVRRLEAARPVELARLVGELAGERCRVVPTTLEELSAEGVAGTSPPPRGFPVIVCEAPFVPDFATTYGLTESYCDSVSIPQVAFLAHGARGRYRVIAELAQNEGDSWAGFVGGEHITALQGTRGAALFEVETGTADESHHTEIVVCSPRTETCRWVQVATGDAPRAYTLTDTTLTVGDVTVTLRDWLAGAGPSFGRADRAHDFPVPFRWAQREADGTRNTEASRCTFVVRDTDGFLNVRAEPDQRSRVLGTIPTGSEIHAVWVTRSWLLIEQPFGGWIFRGATERRCAR